MVNKATNAIVGKPLVSGGILLAPVGTQLPTNEKTAPNAAFGSVGYITKDGVKRSEKPDAEMIKAWGGDPLIELDKGTEFTAALAFAEYLNPLVQKAIYGDAQVTVTEATASAGNKLAIVGKNLASPHRAWIIELFSGDSVGRVIFPDAKITEREDVTYADEEIAARGVTIALFPDASGNYFYEYWDDGRKVLAAS